MDLILEICEISTYFVLKLLNNYLDQKKTMNDANYLEERTLFSERKDYEHLSNISLPSRSNQLVTTTDQSTQTACEPLGTTIVMET